MDALIRRERAEYAREGVACDHIEYPDNSLQVHPPPSVRPRGGSVHSTLPCARAPPDDAVSQVELFDERRDGIFARLDDECRAPNGSDGKFVSTMLAAYAPPSLTFHHPLSPSITFHPLLRYVSTMLAAYAPPSKFAPLCARPRFGAAAVGADLGATYDGLQFLVRHYAEEVAYTAHRWLERNRGVLHADAADLLASSASPLLQLAVPAPPPRANADGGGGGGAGGGGAGGGRLPTVSGSFRAALRALAATMVQTHQHFIRCIKPNGDKAAGRIDGRYVCRQLRYLGVHAVVEINRVGYPAKLRHDDFVRK